MSSPYQPGRLGSPEMTLVSDPRVHPKLISGLRKFGADRHPPALDITPDSPYDDIRAKVAADHEGLQAFYHHVNFDVPSGVSTVAVTKRDEFIPGPNGTELQLTIRRRQGEGEAEEELPALVYIHGGGMVLTNTDSPPYNTWAEALARTGLVVVTVHFRNAYNKDGDKCFPAGLDDCATAGESGGGNLSIATALKANREGWVRAIDAVIAHCPYLSGAYDRPMEWKLSELPSLVECDGYIFHARSAALYVKMYDPTGSHAQDPLAWPYWATDTDLRGLPPHLIIAGELDPLRDEGLSYYRKLVAAEVTAVGKVTLGMGHCTEFALRQDVPELFLDFVWQIKTFIDRL